MPLTTKDVPTLSRVTTSNRIEKVWREYFQNLEDTIDICSTVTVAGSAPSTPGTKDIWIDEDSGEGEYKYRSGESWTKLNFIHPQKVTYVFENATERDAYFTAWPNQREVDAIVAVKTAVGVVRQRWGGSDWVSDHLDMDSKSIFDLADVRPTVDSITSFQFLDAAGANIATIDSVNKRLSVKEKVCMTAIGGIAIKLTNKTGANTIEGQLAMASTGTADAFGSSVANSDETIGVVLEAGVSDGSEAWIVVSGIANVLIDAGGSALGDRMITSATAGSAATSNTPAIAVHFQEVGHCIETRVGAGLARCVLHFN